jgi:hypothetical protein
MNHSEQLNDLLPQIREKIFVIEAMQLRQVALMVVRIPVLVLKMR